jgi:serine phosphatase RsbU (regulator of sigma subunit)/tetratricopeptide (TPR) repeat protein
LNNTLKHLYFIITLLISLSTSVGFSQSVNLDSCFVVLKTAKEDTNKVRLLKTIAWEISYESSYKGLVYAKQAYSLGKKLQYNFGIAISASTIGSIYTDMGDYSKALTFFYEAIDLEKKYNYKNALGKTYSNVGILFGKKRDFEKALSFYRKSVDCFIDNTLSQQLAATYNNIGSVYADTEQFDSAKVYYNKSLKINQVNHSEDNIAGVDINLASISAKSGNYQDALDHIQKAIAYWKIHPNSYNMSYANLIMGSIYLEMKEYNKAIECYNLVKTYAEPAGIKELMRDSYLGLSQCYEFKKDNSNALLFHKKYSVIKDSLTDELNNQQVRDLEINYETEKKNKEIELLTQRTVNQGLEADKRKVILFATLISLLGVVILSGVLYNRFRLKKKSHQELEQTNIEISNQKSLIEIKNKEITDSINYARRIQRVLLTSDKYISKYLNDFFILNKPKAIVSGDFYWAVEIDNSFIIVTADCTGHGVPGAFMSLLGINYLNEIVIEQKITQPDLILNALRSAIIEALNPEGSNEAEGKDGMDLVLCKYDFTNMQLTFSCANNPLWIYRQGEFMEFKADKMPVGKSPKEDVPFTLQTVALQKGDVVYAFTDGYADQFGGPKGKKFMYKQLKDTLANNIALPMKEQKSLLASNMASWQGNLEQVDDILIIGIRI